MGAEYQSARVLAKTNLAERMRAFSLAKTDADLFAVALAKADALLAALEREAAEELEPAPAKAGD
jgi:hypothetical protein